VHTWPGAELLSARSIERTLRRQRDALVALAVVAAAGLAVAPSGHGRMLAAVSVVAAIGALVVSVATVFERDRGDRAADALIEEGFRHERRSDPLSLTIAERIDQLESDRKRRSLADALRAHVELDRSPGPPAPRCPATPVLRGLRDHSEVVERIASEFERGACDPRAIIQVERLLTTPPPMPPSDDDRADLGRRLRRIARLLEIGT
jgi:hypothetical protein